LHDLRGVGIFYVEADRNEVLIDELRNAGIGVNLGFQPSASLSHRCGGYVDQYELIGAFGLGKSGVEIFKPLDGHRDLLMYANLAQNPQRAEP
jgi:hypothetical protein